MLNFCTHAAQTRESETEQHPKHSCHTLKVGNSQPLTATNPPPPGVPPYLRCGKWRRGWCSAGGRGTGDSGKNISSSSPMLADGWRALRCGLHIRTAAATASHRGTGGRGRGKRLSVRGAGGLWQHHFRQEVGQQAPVDGRRTGSRRRAVSGRLCFRVGRSYLAEATCLSESRTGGRLCPPGWEVNVNVVCPLTPSLPSLLVRLLNKTQMASPSSHKSVNAPRICKWESHLR